jgi:segregation and condensation protein A
MKFTLETEVFTGPIDLLLHLIEKRKLAINDISLSEVTHEFLQYVAELNTHEHLSDRIHFVHTASTLALIKTKSLLPGIHLEEEEEHDIAQLKKRLALYRLIQHQSKVLKDAISTKRTFVTANDAPVAVSFKPHESISMQSLRESLSSAINEVPEPLSRKKEAQMSLAIHIEEVMDRLVSRLEYAPTINFQEHLQEGRRKHTGAREHKVYTVVSFLALLELVRNHGLSVQQELLFDDIRVGRDV